MRWRSIRPATRPAFGVLDEVAEEGGAGLVGLRRADRLLHGGEFAVEDLGTGHFLDVLHQARPQAGKGVEPVGDEQVVRGIEARRADSARRGGDGG